MSQLLAESIKRLRKERGLSQQQLADMLYVDRSSIAHWELGRRVPDAEVISRLSQVFNVDVNSLMDAASDESVENQRDLGGRREDHPAGRYACH